MDPKPKIDRRAWAFVLLMALLVRAAVLIAMSGSLAEDPDAYRQIAVSLNDSGTYAIDGVPTAYRPPLYPKILQIFGTDSISVAITHLVFGVLTVAVTFLLGLRVGLARWALLPAMLVAFDPILLNQSTQVMTETTATLLVIFTLAVAVEFFKCPSFVRAVVVGLCFGLSVLCRPELLAWAGLCVVSLPFVLRKKEETKETQENAGINRRMNPHAAHGKPAITLTLAVAVALLGTLTPWAVRNWNVFGQPIPATTHGGYTLLLANNPAFYEYLRLGEWGSTWDADELGPRWAGKAKFASPAEELRADRDAYREAWSNLCREPGMFFYSCLVRAGRLWGLFPHQGPRLVRYAIGFWYLALYALAIVGGWAVWKKKVGFQDARRVVWLWGGLLVVSTTAVHTLFWSNMRMRAPLIPFLALLTAAGLTKLAQNRPTDSSSTHEV